MGVCWSSVLAVFTRSRPRRQADSIDQAFSVLSMPNDAAKASSDVDKNHEATAAPSTLGKAAPKSRRSKKSVSANSALNLTEQEDPEREISVPSQVRTESPTMSKVAPQIPAVPIEQSESERRKLMGDEVGATVHSGSVASTCAASGSAFGDPDGVSVLSPRTPKALPPLDVDSIWEQDRRIRRRQLLMLGVFAAITSSLLLVLEGERLSKTLHQNCSLVTAILAPVVAQLCKPFSHLAEHGQWVPKRATESGGFPSGHSSCVVSLATCVAIRSGWESDAFAMCVAFALVVMYDASHVRMFAGHHARVLNELSRTLPDEHRLVEAVRLVSKGRDTGLQTHIGHKGTEILGGMLLGISFGLFMTKVVYADDAR
eukprot:TRINITY_DN123376_c0_g1_i1.p1 TRINITY_DN123376_c0_g1~~TRINITY_DN123376_c0_g1_i1.p1  ORF type:complete len:372 (-),score=52.57 TRINITY_DN123376_c0_g1_i1:81-1196(-)